ncbi:MAG TPA: efflux RND transporter periplasmic adaptor subunit [Verrucomicrobiae bacterium]|nr:efflux RND transporter periplasmic adaptor subunit [Verrucomicrobiae bacterium]
MKNSILIWGIFAAAAGLLTDGCSRSAKPAGGGGAPVLVARAFTTNVPVQINPPPVGHVLPYSTVTIRPQIGGILEQIHFREGSEVESNALLFTIDPRPMRAALARDQAQLENATAQFNRDQKLLEAKIESPDQFDISQANRDTLAATVRSDELNLSFTEIRAPFDGVTGSLQFHAGNVVKAPDDTLLTINQIHPIYIQFGVPEQYLPEIRQEMGQHPLKVSATFENLNVPPPHGVLTFVDNSIDPTTGMIQLRATFPNEDSALWPGQFVTLTLTLSELTDVVVVPSQAVQTGQTGQFIYVVKSDQTVEERPVTIGITYDGETVIANGLKAGETVVTDGQLRLSPGAAVSVKSANTSTNVP